MQIPRLLLIGACFILAGCGKPDHIEITETRQLPPDEREPQLDATDKERFRIAMAIAGVPQQGQAQQPQQRPTGGPQLKWDTPEGWTEVASSGMREADFRFGEENQGECYVMRAGGSLEANVNRWRGQMGLEPVDQEKISELPTRDLFGMQAVVVQLNGNYTGMGAQQAAEDYRMVGLILPISQTSLFVKMIGPKELVMENEDEFHALCDSLRIES